MPIKKSNKQALAEILKDLAKPRGDGKKAGMKSALHEKQQECLASLFKEDKKTVFVPCGRKFGKTHVAAYALWRTALTKPGTACYYIAPEKTHARELIWKNNRIQKFLEKDSAKYVERIQDREMTIRFKNGSFITLLGSDNWMAANGLTPDFVVYDEFKGFKSQFHIEMGPNLIAKNAPLLIIGTQPKVGDANKDQYEMELQAAEETPDTSAVHIYTTFDNPINMQEKHHERIMQEISKYRRMGMEDVVQREYYSKIVPGGSNAVFPTFRKELHTLDPIKLKNILRRDHKDLKWSVACDPATSDVFAVLLLAINTKTKHVYVVDEIYEKSQAESSVGRIWPRIQAMVAKHALADRHRCRYVADEREAWFINEVRDQFRVAVFPTQKHLHKKHEGVSLIRDLMLFEMITISQDCEGHIKEVSEYARDSKGNIPKKHDHSIDSLRYALGFNNYTIVVPNDIKETVEVLPNIYIEKEKTQLESEIEDFMGFGSSDYWD